MCSANDHPPYDPPEDREAKSQTGLVPLSRAMMGDGTEPTAGTIEWAAVILLRLALHGWFLVNTDEDGS